VKPTRSIANDLSAYGIARSTIQGTPLNEDEARKIHAFWSACNYLALGMIYLQSNPLLRQPLHIDHIKNRLLGHWGASPALSFIYSHLNRVIKAFDLDVVYMAGPGHGAPGVLGPVYLEGSYSEVYPDKSQDEEGLLRFFKDFSFPGGIGSHCTPETPGSIHEGGELGYVLSHACGAAFDNPDLIVAAVVGDGEAETGPLATSWHINKFLNPIYDGAVLPILNLNGYKINNPTLLARISHEELENLFKGYGYTPYFVEGSDAASMHQAMAATMDHCANTIRRVQHEARSSGTPARPRWPMIVLRSPKGWTAPADVDGRKVEGLFHGGLEFLIAGFGGAARLHRCQQGVIKALHLRSGRIGRLRQHGLGQNQHGSGAHRQHYGGADRSQKTLHRTLLYPPRVTHQS